MSKAVVFTANSNVRRRTVLVQHASSGAHKELWFEFDERSRQCAGLVSEAAMEQLSAAANNLSDTALLETHDDSIAVKGTEQLEPSAPLAGIDKAFASKHRSKATQGAFRRMYAAVEDALAQLPHVLEANLAGVVLSGPLVEAQVGDGSVDLLVVLRKLPHSPYELCKQLSGDVLYPIFKTRGVFPGLWCISLDEWKKSRRPAAARTWPKKQRGIVILGESILGEP